MDVLMDGLLTAATLFAGGYCWVLARRVRALKSLDSGLGGAIVNLTRQIELARGTLDEAQASAKATHGDLSGLIAQAEAAASQLRLSLAAARLNSNGRDDLPMPDRAKESQGPTAPAPAPETLPEPFGPVREGIEAPSQAASEPAPTRLADLASLFGEAGIPPATVAPVYEPGIESKPQAAAPLPKPRSLPPVTNPMRRREPIAPVRSEDELMDMLTSLAAGGAR